MEATQVSADQWMDRENVVGTSLVIQWLRLHVPKQGMQVRSLARKLRPHKHWGQKTKMWNRSNTVTNTIKTLKMVHIKKNLVKENVVNTCNGIIFSLKKKGNSDTCYSVSAQLINHVCLFATPWTLACQLPPSMRFSSKNTRGGCHFLLQGIFLTPVSCVSCIGRWIL